MSMENSGKLSTHVLDTYSGKPASGVRIDLSVLKNNQWELIKTVPTNQEGRTDSAMLEDEAMVVGHYELMFHIDEYYSGLDLSLPQPNFLSKVPIRFNIFDSSQKYHVPLLVTPWSFSTYRGS